MIRGEREGWAVRGRPPPPRRLRWGVRLSGQGADVPWEQTEGGSVCVQVVGVLSGAVEGTTASERVS